MIINQLWRDERGSVITCEVILLTTILVIGVIVGAKSLRDAAVTEWADYAQAIAQFDQSYEIDDAGVGPDGSFFGDNPDFCDGAIDDDGPTDSTNAGFCTVYGVSPVGGE